MLGYVCQRSPVAELARLCDETFSRYIHDLNIILWVLDHEESPDTPIWREQVDIIIARASSLRHRLVEGMVREDMVVSSRLLRRFRELISLARRAHQKLTSLDAS